MKRIAILGSGASAVVAASLILEHSEMYDVTIIDFGQTGVELSNFPTVGSSIKSSVGAHLFEIPQIFSLNSPTGTVRGSAAYGGWAESWGGTIVPFSDEEIYLNGVSHEEYTLCAETVMSLLQGGKSATEKRDLRILPKLLSGKVGAKNRRITQVRISDLAIKAFDEDIAVGCNQCGECLSGCPKNHIFKPSSIWPKILSRRNARTVSQVWIERVTETASGIRVDLRSLANTSISEEFDYIFCGLGAIQTAALLVRSGVSDKVLIKDSQLVVVPFVDPLLRITGTKENRISLSDIFVFGKAPLLKDHVYCQLYGSSKSLTETILARTKWLGSLPNLLVSFFLSRIGIAMQFLDSSESGQIEVTKDQNSVRVIGLRPSKSHLFLKLSAGSILYSLCLIPLSLFTRVYKVGDGYHFGSSFPFGTESIGNSSDSYGRPNFMKKLSIIDSSVLNSITAKPNTFNSMVRASVTVERVLNSEIMK